MSIPTPSRVAMAIALCIACAVSGCATAPAPAKPPSTAKAGPDRSPGKQVGKASFYADKFAGRKMADGSRMDPRDDNAASKTLPLGTVARVTNLETGRSAVVTIQDRGPYVKGRIVDLSPATARELGISRANGVAEVEVVQLSIPAPNGSAAVSEATR